MPPGTIVLYVATSLDGYVATPDGGVAWLDEFDTSERAGGGDEETGDDDERGGYDAFFADVDCLVVGSRTYEQVLGFGDWPYADRPTYVATSRDLPRATDHVELVDGDVAELAGCLRREYDTVWLVGGAALAQSFLREGVVDQIRLNVVPLLLGDGIPLFGDGPRRSLDLVETTRYPSGIVELCYDVGTE
ncbi:dihydrofolate reductase family protein [Haloarcula marina]|uniref:dihydrofolate reductase family protein n=1 Tax=Haloarcula marina TaxID=2961574 RepID=UPI0020B76664|nr:dihydrofolate reductase family protein [Halomicroarcula marina]